MSPQQQVKVGDVVIFSAFGREVNALVLAARSGEVSHLGKNGEPLLTLAFIDPPREQAVAPHKNVRPILAETKTPTVFTEHDVVHASHEFSKEFKEKHGSSKAEIAAQRGHGEWREHEGDAGELIASLRHRLATVTSNCNAAESDAINLRGRADIAEKKADDLAAELANIKSGDGE